MRVERGDGTFAELHGATITVGTRGQEVDLTDDDARWLQAVALPAVIAAKVPSDGREKVDGSESDDEQIPGQLAIEG